MKTRLCTCAALWLAIPLVAVSARAQFVPPPPREQPSPPHGNLEARTFHLAAATKDRAEGLIHLDVVVTDAAGKPVSGLDRAGFSLLENGQLQKILSFDAFDGRGAGAEPPVKIILLIDTVELPVELARNERTAVETFLRKDNGHLTHPVSVFLLTDSGLWTVAPSADGTKLVHEIEHNDIKIVRPNKGWKKSALPDPTDTKDTPSGSALSALAQIAADERTRPGRKLLVWVGPGWGIGSGAYADAKRGSPPLFGAVCWFSALLREAQLALYSFTVGESSAVNPHTEFYKDYLDGVREPRKASFMSLYRKVLAVQSGGQVMDDSLDLVREIEKCVQDTGPFYRISFDPSTADHPDEYHALKVVMDRPELQARTNTGYYDEPYYSLDPLPPPRRVSVEQLQALLTSAAKESDADVAKELSGLVLTERLSEQKFASLARTLPAKRVAQELRILADASIFLDPPADEIPSEAPPDMNAQSQMVSRMSDYVNTTLRKLPDLFARQTTVRYQERPMLFEGETSINYQPLHITDSWATTVRYRNGSEITETKPPRRKANDPWLLTYGMFGPALKGVIDAIGKQGGLTWSHWEQGEDGRIAVFRYVIPSDKSLYQAFLCCLPDGDGTEAFNRYVGYHGEIAIDPHSGAIRRLGFQDDLKSTTPLARSEIMIEYGPVNIGGRSYICPQRSVSIVRPRSVRVLSEMDEVFRTYGPYATMLNDITFDRYHIFRSESRMLPDFTGAAN